MKGLKLQLSDTGVVELVPEVVEGVECIKQNALVNLLTAVGSDRVYPDRGTRLFAAGTQGIIHDVRSAQHEANFAALDTLTFSRLHEYASQLNDTIENLQLELREIRPGYLRFQAVFTLTSGDNLTANAAA